MSANEVEIPKDCCVELLQRSTTGYALVNPKLEIIFANPAAQGILFNNQQQPVGIANLRQAAPSLVDAVLKVADSGKGAKVEVQLAHPEAWYQVRILKGTQGMLIYITDITEARLRQAELTAIGQRFHLITENCTDVIWLMDLATMKFTYVSPSVYDLRGFTPQEVMDEPVEAALTPESNALMQQTLQQNFGQIAQGLRPAYTPLRLQQPCKDGSSVWTEVIASFIMGPGNQPSQVMGITSNISQALHHEEELLRFANTDHLTRINNRRYFFERGEQEMARAKRYDENLSLLMIDLDDFKLVNDAHGHEAGDSALRWAAAQFLATCRDVDLVGRLGGEEFGILLPNTSLARAMAVAERVRTRIAAGGFAYNSKKVPMTVSIGAAQRMEEDANLDDLLRRADKAMYFSKMNGRDLVTGLH